jgi:tetratricopeptide (TPR) repeat protein
MLAEGAQNFAKAEQLQLAGVRWAREQAADVMNLPADALDAAQRDRLRTLAVSLWSLGNIQQGRERIESIASHTEAAELAKRAGDSALEAAVAIALGHAYMNFSSIRNISEAERWYRQALKMYESEYAQGRAQCLGQLGRVAYERFRDALAANRPEREVLEHLNAALRSSLEALALIPPDAVQDLAIAHHHLGIIYDSAGDLDSALPHYQHAIRYQEMHGHLYGAAQTRFNVGFCLAKAGRIADARAYALAALRNFEVYGDRAANEIDNARQFLVALDQIQQPSS